MTPELIALAFGMAAQLAMWIYWGGRISERVNGYQIRIGQLEVQMAASVAITGTQATAIAVLGSKMDGIKTSLDTVMLNLDGRKNA